MRQSLIACLADQLAVLQPAQILKVAIDGVDGAGKTHWGDELAEALKSSGRQVIRAGVDGFHQPRALRYKRGRDSATGFFFDSYDYARLQQVLLDPLCAGGSGQYRTAVFDHLSDRPLELPLQQAAANAILIFDGIFLHRPELRVYWDFSIFLQVAFAVSIPRGAQRGMGSPDPEAASNRRYIAGQQLYLRTCQPECFASVVIDNHQLECPRIVRIKDSACLEPF